MVLVVLFVFFIFLFPVCASAGQDVAECDSVEVSASHTGLGTNQGIHIGGSFFSDNGFLKTDRLISRVAAVASPVFANGIMTGISLRTGDPSHTDVYWNGLELDCLHFPGVDMSFIPPYFLTDISLYRNGSPEFFRAGSSGGVVDMRTSTDSIADGIGFAFVQGAGSYLTFEDYVNISYKSGGFVSDTRLYFNYSGNRYRYFPEFQDGNHGIVTAASGQDGLPEYNERGFYSDSHVMQNFSYRDRKSNLFALSVWGMYSDRNMPVSFPEYWRWEQPDNKRRETALRAVAGWSRRFGNTGLDIRAGYAGTNLSLDYVPYLSYDGMLSVRNTVNTVTGSISLRQRISRNWSFSADAEFEGDFMESGLVSGKNRVEDKRFGMKLFGVLEYRPFDRLGVSFSVTDRYFRGEFTPVTPALNADFAVFPDKALVLKASLFKIYRVPEITDFSLMPSANTTLTSEEGYGYDLSLESSMDFGRWGYGVNVMFYAQDVNGWLLRLPDFSGLWKAYNLDNVNGYGMDADVDLFSVFGPVRMEAGASFGWRRMVDCSRRPTVIPVGYSGGQLPYVPEYSASATFSLEWSRWKLSYMFDCTGDRKILAGEGRLMYFALQDEVCLSSVSLEKTISLRKGEIGVSGTVNNIFNRHYLSDYLLPMPGIHFVLHLSYRF